MDKKPSSSEAPLMLSVSGARGLIGRTMTPSVAADFAAAFGSFVKSSTGTRNPILCVGRDTRPSGPMISAAAISGLTAVGCRVIDLGVVATPTVGVMIGAHHAHAGMVITASHNPIIWNGLKCLNADGLAPPVNDAEAIIERFRTRDIDYARVEELRVSEHDRTANETHLAKVLCRVETAPIREAGFRIVLDSVNGAGCMPGRMLLDELGCEVVHLNGEPTGMFAHAPEPTEENLRDLATVTRRSLGTSGRRGCGFAQDPDADRLAIVDEQGRYIGEEYTLVLAAKRVLDMRGGGVLAANLSTSRMLDDLAAGYEGASVVRTAVGEANVAEAMKAAGSPVGGEGNGGVIYPPVCWVRDSLSAMALVLSLLAAEEKSLSEIIDALPRYEMIKRKLDLSEMGGREAVTPLLSRVAEHYRAADVNTTDGVRVDLADGWVHLRASNTEPIIRLIAEAGTNEQARALIREVAAAAGLDADRIDA